MAPATILAAPVLVLAQATAVPAPLPSLPPRVRRIVLHTLGGPFYGRADKRWTFLSPRETFASWKPSFGAHWIVWIDGSVWPRHPRAGEPQSFLPEPGSSLTIALASKLVREATPVYSHVAGRNSASVGIELAHSGRSDDPFPEGQARSATWLVASLLELSQGRLDTSDVVGHKDLDRTPAYVGDRCRRGGCSAYLDTAGKPFRRRVDPPGGLFAALAREGLRVPRQASEGDAELHRAELIPRDDVPMTGRPR
jgi:N-acetylmuramoyl-L-alanine amidase